MNSVVYIEFSLSLSPNCSVDYAVRSHTVDHSPSTYGLWHVEALLSWLDYCEQVVGLAQPVLSDAVCGNIHEMVLTATLLPKLIKTM